MANDKTLAPIIPVYLNQRIVFDVLAMLQDGLSHVAKITTTETDKDALTRGVDTTFGVSQALASLLKIDLSARRTSAKEQLEEVSRSEERVHTPASLLHKLRQMLLDRGELIVDPNTNNPSARQIVEFAASLHRNPVIELVNTMVEAVNMVIGLTATAQPLSSQKVHKKVLPTNDNEKALTQMRVFRDSLTAGGTVDILTDRLASGHVAVLTLEEEFLSDRSMANLVEGQFVVLGKIIRVVSENDSINLLRKTAMSALPDQLLQSAFAHFDALSTVQGFTLPKAEWKVAGPALHILPIAIYA
jgi:hypothetical protein